MSQADPPSDARPDDAEEAALLDAAEALVQRRGPDFTMGELADAVGVSRTTLYRRVGGRRALLKRLERQRGVTCVGAAPTRERIMNAAWTVVCERGPLAATVEQMAEEAGVSPMTVYRVFGDKDSLLRETFTRISPRLVAAKLDRDAPPTEALPGFMTAALRALVDMAPLARFVLFGSGAEAAYLDHLRQRQSGTHAHLTRYFEAQVARGALVGEPAELALSLLGMGFADVLGRSRLGGVTQQSLETRARALVARFLNGALPR